MGGFILLVVVVGAIFAEQIAPYEPNRQRLIARFKPPFWADGGSIAYPLGTDQVGRDIWSRVIHGSRISLIVGVCAVGISTLIGVTLGISITPELAEEIGQNVVVIIQALGGLIGTLMALFGRARATALLQARSSRAKI